MEKYAHYFAPSNLASLIIKMGNDCKCLLRLNEENDSCF